MSSSKLKLAALCWLRFGKQMPFVATEVGPYSADVCGTNGKSLIEIEVKVSLADLKRDFETKNKHHFYFHEDLSNPDRAQLARWVPHRMYFMVPNAIHEKAVTILSDKAPRYGVLTISDLGMESKMPWKHMAVVKRAQLIHAFPVEEVVKKTFLMRMGSEICGLHLNVDRYKSWREESTYIAKEMMQMKDLEC